MSVILMSVFFFIYNDVGLLCLYLRVFWSVSYFCLLSVLTLSCLVLLAISVVLVNVLGR